jgi:hypothetical protein
MLSSLFLADYKKIGFGFHSLSWGPLSALPRSRRRPDMLSSLFLAGYKKIGFVRHFFGRRSGSPMAARPPRFCHPGEVV